MRHGAEVLDTLILSLAADLRYDLEAQFQSRLIASYGQVGEGASKRYPLIKVLI